MAPSVCLACIIFTLEDKLVKENKYVDMFIMWLSQCIKCANLQTNDILRIHMDTRTLEYMNTNTILGTLLADIPFKYMTIPFLPPKNLLEGMMHKYTIVPYTQDIFMYCDIDIYITKSIHTLTDTMVPNTLYLCREGSMTDKNYSADLPSEYVINSKMCGFSAGKFSIYGANIYTTFLSMIQSLCLAKQNTDYYTVEQPYFNHAILKYLHTIQINTDVFDIPNVSFNGHNYKKGVTVFFDCGGEPGNGEVHYTKMLNILCLLNANFFE